MRLFAFFWPLDGECALRIWPNREVSLCQASFFDPLSVAIEPALTKQVTAMGILASLKDALSFQSRHDTVLKAPISGRIIPIEEVPDSVFANKVVGDGLAIEPTGTLLVAPCDGVISKIFASNHAFSIDTPSGIELFVHFGLDTVELDGTGFKRLAQEGQQVKTGEPIMEVDLALLGNTARSIITPIIITSMKDVSRLEKSEGNVEAGVDELITVVMR